jgi:hypothetical protein
MFATIKGVLFEPGVTFAEIEKKATLAEAAGIAIAAGLLQAVPPLVETREAQPAGLALLIAYKVASALILWLVLGVAGYAVARKLLKGTGTLRATLIAFGFAGFIAFLGGIADIVMAAAGSSGSTFVMIFFGWYSVLLAIALRQVHHLSILSAALSLCLVGLAALASLFPLRPAEWLITPLLTHHPFPPSSESWRDEELPANAQNLARNAGFEEIAIPSEQEAAKASAEQAGTAQAVRPEGWSTVPIGARRIHQKDAVVLNQIKYTRTRDEACAHGGQASALVKRDGLPMGMPIAWGWLQQVFSESFLETVLKDAEKEKNADRKKGVMDQVQKVRRDGASYNFQANEELYLSVWLRGKDVTAAAAVVIVGAQDVREPIRSFSETLRRDFDWQEVRIKIKVPSGVQGVAVGAVLWGGGALWIDDARLLARRGQAAVPAAEPPAPPKGPRPGEPEELTPSKVE